MRLFLLLIPVLWITGCDMLPRRVSERFTSPPPQERVVHAPKEEVFRAAQEALDRSGYQITRAGQAQGLIEAQSRLLPTGQFGASRQNMMELRLRSVDPGVTTVTAVLREQQEGDFTAGVSGQTRREAGPYEAFFDLLEQVLHERE